MLLKTNGYEYKNIRVFKNILFKKTSLSKDASEYIKQCDFHFVVNPLRVFNNEIILPFYKSFSNLYECKHNFNELEIYTLLLRQLRYLQILNKKNIIHGDIYPLNVLYKKYEGIKLIDFDLSIVNDIVSKDNIYAEDNLNLEDLKYISINDDKRDTLRMYFYYLINKKFNNETCYDVDISSLNIDYDIKEKIQMFLDEVIDIDQDDYFIDDILSIVKVKKIH